VRTSLFASVLFAVTLAALPAGAASARTGEPETPALRAETRTTPPAIDWQECGTTVKGECATIKVPVDYAHPRGPSIDLAIGRLKALNPAKRIGVLVVHPGGPGQSGIDAYITRHTTIPDDSPLRQYFDVVSVDPRGVGRSSPVLCGKDVLDEMPFTYPANESEYRTWLSYNARLSQDCRRDSGPVFDHLDTTSVARDVDSIRVALGERKISFFAISYGTQVGQQYAELFPENIRAMAIDSNMDHSITSAYAYLKTTTEDFEGSFEAFSRWCAETAACPLHGRDVTALWDDLLRRSLAGELVDAGTGQPIGDEELRYTLFDPMYNPAADWFDLAASLKALADGQPASLAAGPTAKAEGDLVNYAYPAIWCSDWKWDVRSFAELDAYRKRLESVAPHTRLSPFWSDVVNCLNWQGKVPNPQHRLKVHGAPPILLVKGHDDIATPAAWNYAAASQLSSSVILEYDGVGHGQFRNSTCVRDHVVDYLITVRTPPGGTHCAAQFPTQPPATAKIAPDDPRSVMGRPVH
jgi:pimeloyl-ACP methyl ester carboxylesterase